MQQNHTADEHGGALRRVPSGVVHSSHYIISGSAEKVMKNDLPAHQNRTLVVSREVRGAEG